MKVNISSYQFWATFVCKTLRNPVKIYISMLLRYLDRWCPSIWKISLIAPLSAIHDVMAMLKTWYSNFDTCVIISCFSLSRKNLKLLVGSASSSEACFNVCIMVLQCQISRRNIFIIWHPGCHCDDYYSEMYVFIMKKENETSSYQKLPPSKYWVNLYNSKCLKSRHDQECMHTWQHVKNGEVNLWVSPLFQNVYYFM